MICLFALWCAALAYCDITTLRLPNMLTAIGAAGVVGYGIVVGAAGAVLAGGAILSGVYLVVHLSAPAALGAGDVKLAFPLGGVAALAGANAWVWAALAAPVGTAVVGGALLLIRRTRRVAVPHGPFMCAATLFALLTQA